MPSLHTAYATLAAGFFWFGKRWWQKALLACYPLAMGFALLYGGEHYVDRRDRRRGVRPGGHRRLAATARRASERLRRRRPLVGQAVRRGSVASIGNVGRSG